MNWLHRFLHPHCEHCESERIANEQCNTCSILHSQLAAANEERRQLQEALIKALSPATDPPIEYSRNLERIPTGAMTWSQKRKLLEEKDRIETEQRRQREKIEREHKNIGIARTTDELEKELDIPEEVEQ